MIGRVESFATQLAQMTDIGKIGRPILPDQRQIGTRLRLPTWLHIRILIGEEAGAVAEKMAKVAAELAADTRKVFQVRSHPTMALP